jgi:hypothetical protein
MGTPLTRVSGVACRRSIRLPRRMLYLGDLSIKRNVNREDAKDAKLFKKMIKIFFFVFFVPFAVKVFLYLVKETL